MISLTFLVIYKFYHGQLYLLQIFFQKLYSLGPVLKIFNTRRINNLGLLNNTEVLRVKTKKIILSTFSNVEVTEVITFHQPDDDIVSMRFSCVECQENADTTVPDAVHHEIKNIQTFFFNSQGLHVSTVPWFTDLIDNNRHDYYCYHCSMNEQISPPSKPQFLFFFFSFLFFFSDTAAAV